MLSEDQRLKIHRALMRYWSNLAESLGVTKSELLDAIVATDQWIENNALDYNSALPAPFRTNATAQQKAIMLSVVALARYNPELLRRAIAEID